MKSYLLSVCLAISLGNSFSRDSSYTFLFVQSGTKYFTGTGSFNQALESQGHNGMNTFGISTNLGAGISIDRLKLGIGANITTLLNKPNENYRSITCHETTMTTDFGYDLVKKSELSVCPIVGIGFGVAGIRVPEADSTYSFDQVLNGAQNQYFSETKFNWLLNLGIKFGAITPRGMTKSVYPEIQVGYITYLNTFKWKITDMPLSKLNGFYAQIGWVWRLRYN